MMKKITLDEYLEIGLYHPIQKPFHEFCNHYLMKKDNGCFERTVKLKTWFYILSFVPLCVINFFICMCDGGLKEFEFPNKINYHDSILPIYEKNYSVAEKIYKKAIDK